MQPVVEDLEDLKNAQCPSYVVGGITNLNSSKLLDFTKSQILEEKVARFVPQTIGLNLNWFKNQFIYQMNFHKAGKITSNLH